MGRRQTIAVITVALLGCAAIAAAGEAMSDRAAYWSFQPLTDPAVPTVRDTAWAQNPLDHFILAGLEAKGIRPVARADKRTLIRRAYFDLTGLPPTPAEIADFLADDSPRAFERVVDLLLASPHYGERWGRHWLDVARYSDSNGLDENAAQANAWRYRDYVVDAFNRDKPFDQFVIEQLAGDLLPEAPDRETRNERLIATGFLSLGPKVLAEPDERKMEMDIVDEQIDTTGKAFLGLTLGCARCHDHKFDPITARDYYGLAGIFKSTLTMDSFTKIARWHENPVGDEQDAARKRELTEAQNAAQERLDALLKITPRTAEQNKEVTDLRAKIKELVAEDEKLPSAMGVKEGEVVDVALHKRGSYLTLGEMVPRKFPDVLAQAMHEPSAEVGTKDSSGRLRLARWLVSPDHPLTSRVIVNRVWRWHFGEGLVPTTDNFGLLGAEPTNQPLLDWLARQFMSGGWSIKQLHREILLSATYQLASIDSPQAAAIDPQNHLQWRFNPQRMESEVLRDSLLYLGGQLDLSMGGGTLGTENRVLVFNHTSQDGTSYDLSRRSLYLPIVRNNLYDEFELFDYPDPAVSNSDRNTTTVAPQALYLMNSELALDAANGLAGRLLAEVTDAGERVRQAYEALYGRSATPGEVSEALSFVQEFAKESATEIAKATVNEPQVSDASLPRQEARSGNPAGSENAPLPSRSSASDLPRPLGGEGRGEGVTSQSPITSSPPPLAASPQTAVTTQVPAPTPERAAWAAFCQALMASNEFIYVR